MLTPTYLPRASTFAISRNVFSTKPMRRRVFLNWTNFFAAIVAGIVLTGGVFAYSAGIEWWNDQVYLKRESAAIDITKPVFTDALVAWSQRRAAGQPNTSPEMIKQIVITAFDESATQRVDPLMVLAVIAVESRFNYMATSNAGAKGLMQVIPFWHRDKIAVVEAYDPVANIRAGTKVLAQYLKNHNGDVNRALLNYNGSLAIPGANYDTKVLAMRTELSNYVTEQFLNKSTVTTTTTREIRSTNGKQTK